METMTMNPIGSKPTTIMTPRMKILEMNQWVELVPFLSQESNYPRIKERIEESEMAGLFDKQAEIYLDTRPNYPSEWYAMLVDRTTHHTLAWDVGTGNGQAALGVAEHYEQVIGTDVSEAQLKCAMPHPRVRYLHTPLSLSDDELVTLIGGEDSVDLVTVAQAVHWFDLPRFYSIVTRLLRKPGGIFAVWGYNDITVSPTFDPVMKRFHDTTLPFWDPNIQYIFDGYRTLPFPFESVDLGCEGKPLLLDIPKELSFDGFLGMLRSWSAVTTAKGKGIDLLSEGLVKEFESAWGGPKLVKSVFYKAFMLAGKVN
uniref:Methyltransferase type 11 domain-containing protein n=1 Tax=Davidia involucrata TaxID=16924 RepID=A0A5B7B2P0_DAVIN